MIIFSRMIWIVYNSGIWIRESRLRLFKINAMFSYIRLIFLVIPSKAYIRHNYNINVLRWFRKRGFHGTRDRNTRWSTLSHDDGRCGRRPSCVVLLSKKGCHQQVFYLIKMSLVGNKIGPKQGTIIISTGLELRCRRPDSNRHGPPPHFESGTLFIYAIFAAIWITLTRFQADLSYRGLQGWGAPGWGAPPQPNWYMAADRYGHRTWNQRSQKSGVRMKEMQKTIFFWILPPCILYFDYGKAHCNVKIFAKKQDFHAS